MTKLNNTQALERADKLIEEMSKYLGKMAPYDGFYADLNEHFIFMAQMRRLYGNDA